jgi:anti-sigma regulatory factor (Ser/Thr protein kinase)
MAIDVNGHCGSVPRVTPPPHHSTGRATLLSFHVDLPLADHAAVLARRTVADVLHSWQTLDEDWIYDVQLLCSELVGNAVRHGGERVELSLALDELQLTVEVSDGSSVVPQQRADGSEESGRGLAIIHVLADEWGVRSDDRGKTVWATMTVPTAPQQRRG